jgi:hypothetical protein
MLRILRRALHEPGMDRRLPLALNGGGTCEVVGESFYQAAIDRLCGGKCKEGHRQTVTAHLVLEPSNPHDSNAVKVMVGEAHVGHLSRADALAYRCELLVLERDGWVGCCAAEIRGGWDRGGGDTGHYGVFLELAPPGRILSNGQA